MDVKKTVEGVIDTLKKDPKMLEKFSKEPIPVVEKLVGVDLPDDQIKQVADLVKAKVDLDKASSLLGGLFKK